MCYLAPLMTAQQVMWVHSILGVVFLNLVSINHKQYLDLLIVMGGLLPLLLARALKYVTKNFWDHLMGGLGS